MDVVSTEMRLYDFYTWIVMTPIMFDPRLFTQWQLRRYASTTGRKWWSVSVHYSSAGASFPDKVQPYVLIFVLKLFIDHVISDLDIILWCRSKVSFNLSSPHWRFINRHVIPLSFWIRPKWHLSMYRISKTVVWSAVIKYSYLFQTTGMACDECFFPFSSCIIVLTLR